MNTTARQVSITIFGVLFAAGMAAAGPIDTRDAFLNDLWQNPTAVTSSALYSGSNAGDIFGGDSSTVEHGRTIFADGLPQGTVHSVNWTMPSAVTLNTFYLLATGDIPNNPLYRSITHFALRDDDGNLIYETDITQPANDWVELWVTLPSAVTEDSFRAEFTQGGPPGYPSGPRIAELDAFYVPEPGTVTLIGLGIAALIFTRRSKAK